MSHQLEMEGGGLRSPRPSILALDLSLTACGWCFDQASGVIKSRLKGYERLAEITSEIYAMTFDVDVVVVEGYAFGAQGRAVYQLAGLGEVVRFWLWQRQIKTVEIAPATLKKYATGRGNAGKDEMLAAAIRRFYFAGSENNQADAYLLWCMAREAYGGPIAKVPADRAALVHRLRWPDLGRKDAA